MPRTPAIKKVLIIGSGPIVIGQAAEFDYSGSQASKAIREEGIETIIVNSNPATIQTDTTTADRVYLEPLTVEYLEEIIAQEKPDSLLAGVGGQTALNLAKDLYEQGILQKYNVQLIGTAYEGIVAGEDRNAFVQVLEKLQEPYLPSKAVYDVESAIKFAEEIDYPVIIRAAFTLGGTGSGVAYTEAELREKVAEGVRLSQTGQVLLEKSVLGWGEFEYEVVRDAEDNALIVCTMENIDPMGVHTGESIVVAPSQNLSDQDHQKLRDSALNVIRGLNVRGGCNIQFTWNYETGEYYIIEVNPRLSRSSALASKATGYPIARVAAKIALGYALWEIQNQITKTSAFFEPALDYVVIKIPRWPFDKFKHADATLGVKMKSTGEVMALGHNFEEALQKAIRSLEVKDKWLVEKDWDESILEDKLIHPTWERPWALYTAFARGYSIEKVFALTNIHRWFLHKFQNIASLANEIKNA